MRILPRNIARSLPWFVLGLCTLLCGTNLVRAQGIITGAIAGTVIDPRGAVVPGAVVTAVEQRTGARRDTLSLGNGDFTFQNAPIGIYTVTISATGFRPVQIDGVRVEAGVVSELGEKKLGLGVTSKVTVEQSNPVHLDTTESQVSTTFSALQIENLPLANGYDSIALLVPGVARTLNDNFSNTNGAGISVNGQRGRSNNFETDGQSNNDNSIAGPMIYFGNPDALAEVQVITDNFSAEYGRNMGSVVNYITKSGTNIFHGTAFEFYTGSWLSSLENQQKSPLFGFCLPGQDPATTGCIVPTRPRLVDNRFGGTFGGPLLQNKLWFFGSAYWERAFTGTQPSGSLGAVTPTPTGLQQLAAAFPGNPAVSILKTAGPFGISVGNPIVIPGTVTTETVTAPSGPTPIQVAQFQRSIPTPYTDQEQLGRLDWQPDPSDRFYLRYFHQYDQTAGSPAPSIAQGQYVNIENPNHAAGADWTHIFNPHWTDQLRYSFEQSKVDFQGGSEPACTTTDLTACTAEVYFIGSTNDSGFGMSGNDPQGRTIKITQVQNNAHWTHGNHNVAFGGEWDYQNSPNVFLPGYNGLLLYSNMNAMLHDATGTGMVQMANGSPVIPFTENDTALYAQDDWRIRPDLTLNLGLRWEYFGQAVNELHALSLAQQTGPNPFWNTSLPLTTTTVPQIARNWKDYEPRVGFAWNPSFAQKYVVRGGFSIGYDPAFYNMFLLAATHAPMVNMNTVPCGGGPCLPASGSLTGAAVRAADLHYLGTGGNPALESESYFPNKFLNPYTQTYSLGVEYQLTPNALVSIRYVGNHTVHNFQATDANPYLLPVATQFPNVVAPSSLCADPTQPGYGRLSCARGNFNEITNGAFSLYNGLQTSILTRNLHGLTANFSYTYSRTIDNVTEVISNGAGGTTLAYAQNPLHTDRAERNVSGNSYPNVAALGLTYALPFYAHQSDWKNRLFGGYTYDMVYTYNTGQPYNAYQPLGFTNPVTGAAESSFCDIAFNQAYLPADTCRLVLANPQAPLNTVAYNAGPGNGYVVYNPSASGPPVPTSPAAVHWIVNNANEAILLGNPYPGSGRNILRGQNFYEVDASISKALHLVGRLAMQFQVTAYNLFNHDYLGTPYANLNANNPGAPVNPFLSNRYNNSYGNALIATGGLPGNRVVQLGSRVLF
jgi:hypothetical protein